MNRGSPVATRTDTSRPDATLFRSRALAGRISAEKREELGATRANAGVEAAVLTLPDSSAWLLNVRGGDVVHSPLPLSFALLHADGGVEWFVDPDKVTPEVTAGLGNAVSIEPPARSEEHTSDLQSLMRISYAVFCLKKKTLIRISYDTCCLKKKTTQCRRTTISPH